MKKKTWKIYPELLHSNDVDFIKAQDCNIIVLAPPTYKLPGTNRELVIASGIILIETTCEKQEHVLKLKYGLNFLLS